MNRVHIASASLATVLLASLVVSADSGEDGVGVEIGDYWKYSLDVGETGMDLTGTLEMKVDRIATLDGEEVFYLKMSGYGDASGSMNDTSVSGPFDLDGEQVRLTSDFSILSENIALEMEMDLVIATFDVTMGFEMDYSPSWDDFIGDGDLTLNSVQTSEFTTTYTYWMNALILNESESWTMSAESTLTVVDESVSVTVPAGTFDCCKVKVETSLDNSTETQYWYYSDEVGFYVKYGLSAMGMGGIELESYGSAGEGGIMSMLTGDYLWLTVLIIVVVVVIIAVAIAMKSRRGRIPAPMTPPQPDTQIPPPPRPGQPEMPPPGEPMQPPQNPPTG